MEKCATVLAENDGSTKYRILVGVDTCAYSRYKTQNNQFEFQVVVQQNKKNTGKSWLRFNRFKDSVPSQISSAKNDGTGKENFPT